MGRHDVAARRKSARKQRETGCSLYLPGEVLEALGFKPAEPPPYYRVWPGRRRTVIVQLYREP
jgi:hypothetical protein